MSSVETSAYWMMRCPHCDCTTVVNFEKMAVRSDIT
jgi:phage FluMu protein Com